MRPSELCTKIDNDAAERLLLKVDEEADYRYEGREHIRETFVFKQWRRTSEISRDHGRG